MSDELKACPFCNSDDTFNRDNGFGQNLTGCRSCGARVYYKFSSLDNAATAWNTRPIEYALQKEIEIYKKNLQEVVTERDILYKALHCPETWKRERR